MRKPIIIMSIILPLALAACPDQPRISPSRSAGLSGGSGRTLSLTFGPGGEVETVSVGGGEAYPIESLTEAFPPTIDKGTLNIVSTLVLRVENWGSGWCAYSINGHIVWFPC